MKKKFLQLSVLLAGIFALTITTASAQWNTVGPVAGPGFKVFCLRSFGDNLYAGGTGIAKWDGTAWTDMGKIVPTTPLGLGSLGINTMVVFNGELYVAGDIDSIGGVYINPSVGVAKWDGTTWQAVGTSSPNLSGVTSLVVYRNELYASGNYGVNKWDGTAWTSIGTVNGPANVVIAVYHDELYAASSFSHIGTATMTVGKGFAKWDGTTWTALTGFFDTLSVLPGINAAKAAAMIVFKDELYVLGSCSYAGTLHIRGVGKWNGTTWNTTNGGIAGNGSPVSNCMSIDSNNIYAVGPFQKANTTNDSIYLSTFWDGTKWNQMFGGNAPYTSFFATENYKGDIYSAYTSLVKWTKSTAVQSVASSADMVNVYPNPSDGTFHLSLNGNEPYQVRVRNMMGATVYYEQVSHPSNNYTVTLGNVPNGLYLVEVAGTSKTEIKKIMVVR